MWRAIHRRRGLEVAIKVAIERAHTRMPATVQAFSREVRAVAGLSHPGIVEVLDYGTIPEEVARATDYRVAAGSPYLVMERAAGTLADDIGRLRWPEIEGVLLQVLDALAHAHSRDVIHRDLKPTNVLRFPSGSYKLADFGLAHVLASEQASDIGGTPVYMAPEQWAHQWRDYGPWTDMFAVGCIACVLLRGRPPSGVVLPAIPEVLRDAREHIDLPPGIEPWLASMMRDDFTQRTQRAADATWGLMQLRKTIPERPQVPPQWRRPDPPPATRLLDAGLGLYDLKVLRMAGRQDERDVLWNALIAAAGGQTKVVVLRGRAGVGKTRLAQWITERAHEVGAASTLRAVHSRAAGPRDGLSAMAIRATRCAGLERAGVIARVRKFLPDGSADDHAGLVELLCPRDRGEPAAPLPTAQIRDAGDRFALLEMMIRRMCADRPVVLHIDDSQFSDIAAEFVTYLLHRSAAQPLSLLVVMTVQEGALEAFPDRAATQSTLQGRSEVRTMPIEPLAGDERRQFVQSLLGLRAELADEVEERTAGNPLFAVQLVDDWIRRRLLEAGEDGFKLVSGPKPRLPDALHDLWLRRVRWACRGRPQSDLHSLELAALLGVQVDLIDWQAVCEEAGLPASVEWIDILQRHQLLTAEEGGFAFTHGMLVESLRRASAEAGRLSGHLEHSARALQKAGLKCYDQGQLSRALALDEASLALFREAGNRQREGQLLSNLGMVHHILGHRNRARQHLEAALSVHREIGNLQSQCRTLSNMGNLDLEQGRLGEARSHFGEALTLSREIGDQWTEGKILGNLGNLEGDVGDIDAATRCYERSIEVSRAVDDVGNLGNVLGNLGELYAFQGRLDDAMSHFEQALVLHRQTGLRRFEGMVFGQMGALHMHMGKDDEAWTFLEDALLVHREVGDPRMEGHVLGKQALLLAKRGEVERAADAVAEGERLLREVNDPNVLAILLCDRAEMEHVLGESSVDSLQAAREIAARIGVGSESELGLAVSRIEALLAS